MGQKILLENRVHANHRYCMQSAAAVRGGNAHAGEARRVRSADRPSRLGVGLAGSDTGLINPALCRM